jgi:hypothetical protein
MVKAFDAFMRWLDPWDDGTPDLLDTPKSAYEKLADDQYKAEAELAEKYRSFVSEIMRLSLAGLAVFSFLYGHINKPSSTNPLSYLCIAFACLGVIFFAISIGYSLRFLFGASEGLRWYIVGLRHKRNDDMDSAERMLSKRNGIIEKCRHDKRYAADFLLFGTGSMALATIFSLVPLFIDPD